jgi:4-hydroxybenzoate polyprenyltransferase
MNGRLGRPAAAFRAGEWWDHKLVPALAVFYGTALSLRVPVAPLAAAALALLVAVAAAAAFVSVINDLADRADDAAAGKANRMSGRPRGEAALLLAAPLAVGLGFLFAWRADLPLLLAYAGSWLAFSLYSLPPFRLKTRGLAGVAADAAGAHLFPSLVAVLLACAAAGSKPDLRWTAAVGLWSFAYGVRGILWHQLRDRDNDRRAGVSTFAGRFSPERTARLGAFVIFPLEIAGLAAMLLRLEAALPLVALLAYALLLVLRARLLGTRVVILGSGGDWAMVLQEYYELFLPVSILCATALAYPLDWLVLLAHLALFPRRARAALGQVAALARRAGVSLSPGL